jgi:MFS family permease
MSGAAGSGRGWRAVPRTVWALGLVSLFMDFSSEMIHGLLPLFLVGTLGASAALLGWIEGAAEATVSIAKVFSGWLSDRLGRRKLLTAVGYGLAALSKPLFPLAAAPGQVLVARLCDRIGKGVRGAPRDALIADVTPAGARGAAFGLRQSLDTVGAVLGPLAAIGLMILLAGDIRAVFWWALVPAAVAVVLLVVGVEEPKRSADAPARPPLRLAQSLRLGRAFWSVALFGALFTLARFSEAFLILRVQQLGLALAWAPLVLVVMNLVYAAFSAPVGNLSDRVGRRAILAASLGVLIGADLLLAWARTPLVALVGVAVWGLHMGMSQGLLSALVADAAPADLRGTAFGLFNLLSGAAMLLASGLAGTLWSAVGSAATFWAGAAFAALALGALLRLDRGMEA